MTTSRLPYGSRPSPGPFQLGEASEDSSEIDAPYHTDDTTGDISDEKADWDPSKLDDKERDDPTIASPSLNFNQRPRSATSSFRSQRDSQVSNSQGASRPPYMEDYSQFRAGLEGEPNNPHDNYDDDDDDDWGDSNIKKRSKSSFFSSCSIRGVLNMGAVTLMAIGLIILFGVLPITTYKSTHLHDQQRFLSRGALHSDNPSNTRQRAMARRGFNGTGQQTFISDRLVTDGSLNSVVYPEPNPIRYRRKWETWTSKTPENQPINSLLEERRVVQRNNKRPSRKIIDLGL